MTAILLFSLAWAETTAEGGKPAPDFTLKDLAGDEVQLSTLKGKTVVLEWFNPGCPYVVYAHGEGPLTELAAKRVSDDVVWLGINSGAPGKQGHGLDVNKQAVADWNIRHPILMDESGDVGRAYGAKTTPQMFVIDPEGVVQYAGALDNAPFGKVEGEIVPYLDNALRAVSSGHPVKTTDTKPYGCSVKY